MAAHFCPQCGHEVSSAARFCMNCAARLDGSGPTAQKTGTTLEAAAQKSRRLLVPAVVAALIVLIITVAVLAGRGRPQPSIVAAPADDPPPAPSVVAAPTQAPAAAPPLTNAPTQPLPAGPAVTNTPTAPAAPPPTLPPDVKTYLAFLYTIEQRRVAMNADVSGASAMMGMVQGMQGAGMDPEGEEDKAKQNTQQISQGYNDYALKWQGLIRDFRSTPAPQPCLLLANKYLTFLSDYTTVITKMQVALLNHDSHGLPDMSGVTQVQAEVDADGAQADTELGNLCSRYGVAKPFAIASEGASPSLLGH